MRLIMAGGTLRHDGVKIVLPGIVGVKSRMALGTHHALMFGPFILQTRIVGKMTLGAILGFQLLDIKVILVFWLISSRDLDRAEEEKKRGRDQDCRDGR